MTDYDAITKQVLSIDPNLVGVAVIKENTISATVKAGAPKMEEADWVRMATQA